MKLEGWFSKSYRGYYLLFILSGILMLAWGISVPSKSPSQLLVALGAAIVGSCLSLFFSSLKDIQVLDVISELNKSLKSKSEFSSNETDIENYRKLFHCYRVTEFTEGQPCWRYSKIDFSMSNEIGKLLTTETILNDKEEEFIYNVTAGKRDARLIILRKGDPDEPISISIFPDFGMSFDQVNCGINVHMTFRKNHKINPAILCLKPIKGIEKDEDIPIDIQTHLMEEWKNGIIGLENLYEDFTLQQKEVIS